MYLEQTKSQGKYTCYLLRETYRQDGKVKHRTIANLSRCSPQEIQAIRLALRHKDELTEQLSLPSRQIDLRQGLSVGGVWLLYDLARQLGIVQALGPSRQGKLALWQVIARVLDQGSRLSAVRLAGRHAACDILGLDRFHEDDLYANLDWLAEHQDRIEDRLFKRLHPTQTPGLYLYDVTSSYLEGTQNELAAFGYNRDGKKGKRQIVIGLLCDASGRPLSIEVFAGNTSDVKTMAHQIRKAADRFGGGSVTFVGDRGMIKSPQIADLNQEGFHYITALTRSQIDKLLSQGILQMSLFDQPLAEVQTQEGLRYILRRNPVRAEEIRQSRQQKLSSLRSRVAAQNTYLAEHPRAKVEGALRRVTEQGRKLRVSEWVTITATDRVLAVSVDSAVLAELESLDGCYALTTDLSCAQADKETIHSRYRDLSLVEQAFRTSKTVELEMRPIHVRLARRTRGHALVVMLGYRLVQELAKRWSTLNLTVQEGLDELSSLCATEVLLQGSVRYKKIPTPRASVAELLRLADVKLPEVLPSRGVTVATRKKLPENRPKHAKQST
jgi:transposase